MRRTWDALAGSDSPVYVGDPATGAEELAGLFGRLGADPRGGVCVEVGCGPGRMTGALAERFDEVLALDVSPAMLERARANVPAGNVEFRPVSGERLEGVDDGVADALVCYLVLQHLPSRAVIEAYLREFARVLAPGGEAFVQVPVLVGAAGRLWRAIRTPLVPLARRPDRGAAFRGLPVDAGRARCRARRSRAARPRRGRRPVGVPLQPRPLPAARPRMTAATLAVYGVLLAAAVVAVLRRPAVALYLFVLGLPLHNIVMSLLYGGGVRGGALDAVQAWKEVLLAAALLSVVATALRRNGGSRSGRCSSTTWRSPSRPSSSSTRSSPRAPSTVTRERGPCCTGSATISSSSRPTSSAARSPLDIRRLRWTIAGAAAAVAAWG